MSPVSPFTFSRRNVVFSSLCFGGLALLLLASVMPLKARHRALDQELVTLQQGLTKQQQSQRGIAMVDGLLAKLDQQPGPQVIASSPLAQDQTGQIMDDLRAIAQASSLELEVIEPMLDNKVSWQTLTVHAELQGLFPNLQPFLLKVLSLPYVKQIERIEIHPGGAGLRFSLTYTIILA